MKDFSEVAGELLDAVGRFGTIEDAGAVLTTIDRLRANMTRVLVSYRQAVFEAGQAIGRRVSPEELRAIPYFDEAERHAIDVLDEADRLAASVSALLPSMGNELQRFSDEFRAEMAGLHRIASGGKKDH